MQCMKERHSLQIRMFWHMNIMSYGLLCMSSCVFYYHCFE